MIRTIKQYKKSLIKYAVVTLLFGFGLGLPGALLSVRIISGNGEQTRKDTMTTERNTEKTMSRKATTIHSRK